MIAIIIILIGVFIFELYLIRTVAKLRDELKLAINDVNFILRGILDHYKEIINENKKIEEDISKGFQEINEKMNNILEVITKDFDKDLEAINKIISSLESKSRVIRFGQK